MAQADELDEAAKYPAAQGVHEVESGADEEDPAGQGRQRVPFTNEPAGHEQASESLEPEAEKPAAHVHVEGLELAAPAVEFELAGQDAQALDGELKK
jgi:hypothetical protein